MERIEEVRRFDAKRRAVVAALLLTMMAAMLFVLLPSKAYAVSIPELASEQGSTDVALPVKVTLNQNDTRTQAMALIKQYRKEALDEGIVTLPTGMTSDQYINGIKWDPQIEAIAVQRAIEGAAYFEHTRPNGNRCFTAQTATASSYNEILAPVSRISVGIRMFYGEKEDYIKKLNGQDHGVTGHYEAMIDPENVAYGFGAVSVRGTISGTGACVAGEASWGGQDGASLGYSGEYDATIRVKANDISFTLGIGNNPLAPNYTTRAIPQLSYSPVGSFGHQVAITSAASVNNIRFTSSDASVATIDASGVIRGLKEGTTNIDASYLGKSARVALTVSNSQIMYRLYNPNSGEHFYTASKAEYDSVGAAGWNKEGEAWTAPVMSSTPVYRLYSGTDHHYTPNEAEKDMLVGIGWSYEGIGWYSDDAKRVPLLRQFNPNVDPNASTNNSGSHNYTTSEAERDSLVSIGWKDEGIGWYGM